ncbi:MAG: CvpA family protein [Gammaproteobacteria bacterium]|nr:CvpA family protein [Gammaproteobacteria bacterium]
MIWVDWVIVGVLLISTSLSWLKGLVNEALSLVIWFAALFVVFYFSPSLATVLADSVNLNFQARFWLARVILFVSTMIVGAILKRLVGRLVKVSGLSKADRLMGMAFGFSRGVLLLLIAATLLRWVSQPEASSWWQQSLLIPYLQVIEQNTLAVAENLLSNYVVIPAESS